MSYAQTAARAHAERVTSLVPFVLVAAALSVLGLLSTTPLASSWFTGSPRVDWTPHTSLFTLIWTALYFGDGLAGWLIVRARRREAGPRNAMTVYWVQVVLQAFWVVAFMAQALVAGAWLWAVFAVVVLLDLATVAAAISAWRASRLASVILWVVLAWLLFGTVLSGADTLLQVGLP